MNASELTVRDVLQQLDRRMTSLETRVSSLETRLASIEDRLLRLADRVDAQIAALRAEMTSGFRWIIGLVVVQWLTMVGMVLPLLLRA